MDHDFTGEGAYRPIVVWNITDMCNLSCEHCYFSAVIGKRPVLMTMDVIRKTIDELAEIGTPVVLFSGGEPLVHPNIVEAVRYTHSKGIKPVLSSNGTLITPAKAAELVDAGLTYIGISLDGTEETHNAFRRHPTAYKRTMDGIRNAIDAGMRVSVRLTLTSFNESEIFDVLEAAEEVGAHRLCIYHLVPSGRAKRDGDISNERRREIVEELCQRAVTSPLEILTVDNPADGPVTYMWAREHLPERADEILAMLQRRTPGDGTGRRVVEIDHQGDVHPNQFWLEYTYGSILEDGFTPVWNNDGGDELLARLREPEWKLEGYCGTCSFRSMCGGFRARAARFHGSAWAEDPSCALTVSERLTGAPERVQELT